MTGFLHGWRVREQQSKSFWYNIIGFLLLNLFFINMKFLCKYFDSVFAQSLFFRAVAWLGAILGFLMVCVNCASSGVSRVSGHSFWLKGFNLIVALRVVFKNYDVSTHRIHSLRFLRRPVRLDAHIRNLVCICHSCTPFVHVNNYLHNFHSNLHSKRTGLSQRTRLFTITVSLNSKVKLNT